MLKHEEFGIWETDISATLRFSDFVAGYTINASSKFHCIWLIIRCEWLLKCLIFYVCFWTYILKSLIKFYGVWNVINFKALYNYWKGWCWSAFPYHVLKSSLDFNPNGEFWTNHWISKITGDELVAIWVLDWP